MKLGDKIIGQDFLTICEAGSTTRGDKNIAMKLADAAKEAGASAIKFILSNPDTLSTDPNLMYGDKKLYDIVKSYQIPQKNWEQITAYCRSIELPYFFSVGTRDYLPLAVELGSEHLKLSAWDARNFPLISDFLETGLPIQIDIGCLIGGEVHNMLEFMYANHNPDILLVYESHSPNANELNLLSVKYLADLQHKYTGVHRVGYSANWRDPAPDQLAIGLGATVIEKRIKIDDEVNHHTDMALNPQELRNYIQLIKSGERPKITFTQEEVMLGQYGLWPSLADISGKNMYMTSMVFAKDIAKGEVVTKEHITAKRPGFWLSPYYDYLILGREAFKDFKADEPVSYELVVEWHEHENNS